MIIVSTIIIALYSFLIIAFIVGFDRIQNSNLISTIPKTKFSIVIPFRDEAENLKTLLESLSLLNYPVELFEVLLIDDDSKDESVEIINDFLNKSLDEACLERSRKARGDINILKNKRKSNSPKKDAVEIAIKNSRFDWIITTDADCIIPQNWLLNFDAYIQTHQVKLIAAPVKYSSSNSLLDQFQLLDFLSLQGSTIGSYGVGKPFMCNGANLCYEKQTFIDVNGFDGNEHIASGDDIFLLEKIGLQNPNEVYFLKSDQSIITTNPEATFKKLISQRVRWAAKSTSYNNSFSILVSVAVFSVNALLILLFLGSIIGYYSWWVFIIFFLIKFCIDFILLFKTASFFKKQSVLKHYVWSSIVYPIYTIFIALTSFTISYSWKGRVYKK